MFIGERSLIIDTNVLAAPFFRQMSAFITGRSGCEPAGSNIAVAAKRMGWPAKVDLDGWLDRNLRWELDSGVYRACKLAPSPQYLTDGFGRFYHHNTVDHEAVARAYNQTLDDYCGYLCDEDREVFRKSHPRKSKVQLEPALFSVAILIREEPPKNVCEELRCRAYKFPNVLGYLARVEAVPTKEFRVSSIRFFEKTTDTTFSRTY